VGGTIGSSIRGHVTSFEGRSPSFHLNLEGYITDKRCGFHLDVIGFIWRMSMSIHSTEAQLASTLSPNINHSIVPMYNPREELFERDEDDSQPEYAENTLDVRSNQPSLSFSTLTTAPVFDDSDDEIYFPSYDNEKRNGEGNSDDHIEGVESSSKTSTAIEGPVFPSSIERSEDDSAACVKPSQHVDYLSYDWDEEDIWSSWKHLVKKRKVYPNIERLENASWRTWEKKRRNLKTISPETVRW
jgi:hypothetical protein